MNEIFKIGLKIAAALLAGGAVYVGLDKISSKTKEQQPVNESQPDNTSCSNSNSGQCCCENKPQQREMNAGEKAVDCLKKTQDTCSKALGIIQNLTVAVDSIVRIFNGGGSTVPNYNYGGYYNNGGGYNDTPPGFRRISPCILEYVGPSRNNNCNNNNSNSVWGY